MKKAICLIRTSTLAQEIESQREEVLQMAYDDGLKENEVIVVGQQGASAIKVDEAYQRNMNEVYRLIENTPSINCVYAFAIDRIGRKESILHSFREFLVDRKIQLKIKANNLQLLDKDGNEDFGVKIQFSLYATLAAAEMKNKAERFRRAKDHMRKQGKYLGGPLKLFGYKVDEKGYYVEDEIDGQNVRTIFEEYSTGKWSLNTLTTEMYERGAKKKNMNKIPLTTIRTVLYNYKKYCGEDTLNNYPPIISKSLAYKVKAMLDKNKQIQRSATHSYFAHGIIKCLCGTRLRFNGTHYQCVGKKNELGRLIGELPKCNLTHNNINGGVLDGILWQVALDCHEITIAEMTAEKKEQLQKELKIIECKINTVSQDLNKFSEKRKKLAQIYVLEDLDEKEMMKMRNKIDEQEKSVKSHLNELYANRDKIVGALRLEGADHHQDWFNKVHLAEVVYNATEKDMNDLVRQYIKEGTLGKFGGNIEGWNFNKIIEIVIQTTFGIRRFLYLPHIRGKRVVYELKNGNPEPFGFDEIVRGKNGEMKRVWNGER